MATSERIWPWQPKSQELPEGSGTFGLLLFFLSLSILFFASAVGLVVVRNHLDPNEATTHSFPLIGWISSVVLLALSGFAQGTLVAVRRDQNTIFRLCLVATWVLSVLFLILQIVFWQRLLPEAALQDDVVESGLYGFFVLTGLHAAHVVGGMMMQTYITVQGFRGRYWSLRHETVRGTTLYWHFLLGVWVLLVLFLLWL